MKGFRLLAEAFLHNGGTRGRIDSDLFPFGFFIADPAGRLLEVNPSLARMTGRPSEELLRLGLSDLLAPESRDRAPERLAALGNTGSFEGTLSFVRADGRQGWWSASLVRLPGDGRVAGFVADITAKQEAEAAFRETESRLRALLETIPHGVQENDLEGTITFSNAAHSRMHGVVPGALVGRKLWDLPATPEARRQMEEQFRRILRDRPAPETFRGQDLTEDGRIIDVAVDWTYKYDDRGELIGFVSVITDVTEHRQAEEALRESEERLRLTLQASDQGWYDLDVRTGIAVVSPEYATMLGHDPATFRETHDRWIERMHPDDRAAVLEIYEDYLAGKAPEYRVEFRQKTPGGDWKWILSLGSIVERDVDGRPTRMLGTHVDLTRTKEIEARQRFFLDAINASLNEIYIFDARSLCFQFVSAGAAEKLGFTLDELRRMTPLDIKPEFTRATFDSLLAPLREGTVPAIRFETVHRRADGSDYPVDVHLQKFDQGGRAAFLAVILDITERKAAEKSRELLEAQLRQAGKLEAVGRLAGGVAHDFNNMLNVILGHTELAQQATSASDRVRRNLEEIGAAARRSADLTRQLLAFSRQQPIAPRALDLNDQVGRIEQLLRRLIGEDVVLEPSLAEGLWPVSLDPSQSDQVLANLCINARDAMPNGGRLRVETRNVVPSESHLRRHPDVAPGEFVLLSVSDTGCGMTEKVMERAFEPFFTTKPEGQGTGLGLATVYGIAKQNGGFVEMSSTPGGGTTVSLYLPRCGMASESNLRGPKGVSAVPGSGTILLVEDEPQLLALTGELLERLGYNVLKAGSPEEALRLAASRPGGIDLVLTDVVMPTMNGRQLTARLRTDEPDLKVLYMSGYPADTVAPRGVLQPGAAFIGKPFSLDALARKVREVLRTE